MVIVGKFSKVIKILNNIFSKFILQKIKYSPELITIFMYSPKEEAIRICNALILIHQNGL